MTLTYPTASGWRAIWQGFIARRYFRTERAAQVWLRACSKSGRPQQ